MFSVSGTSSTERWIFINAEQYIEDTEEFVIFVREYELLLSGDVFHVPGDTHFAVTKDPLKLVFQWDSLFGISVIVPKETNIDTAMESMRKLCDIINEKMGSLTAYDYFKQNYQDNSLFEHHNTKKKDTNTA